MLAYGICFSLSDLLHSVWQTLGPPTSLQITQFRFFLCKPPFKISLLKDPTSSSADCSGAGLSLSHAVGPLVFLTEHPRLSPKSSGRGMRGSCMIGAWCPCYAVCVRARVCVQAYKTMLEFTRWVPGFCERAWPLLKGVVILCQSLREKVGIYMNSWKQTHKQGIRRQERGLSSLCGALVLRRVNICEWVPKLGVTRARDRPLCETATGQRWVNGVL